MLRMRGARIPRGVEPSQILSHQARRPGEDGVDRKVSELSRLVAKGEMGIQLAMRELCQNPKATTIHQERLLKQIPGGQMLAIMWAILSSEERAKELYFHDRRGLVERTNEPERSSRAKERQPEQHKGESFFRQRAPDSRQRPIEEHRLREAPDEGETGKTGVASQDPEPSVQGATAKKGRPMGVG